MKLSQVSAVLTGASGGIGAACARRLVHEGSRVLLVGRSSEALLKLASELGAGMSNRNRVDALVVDVTTETGRNAIRDAAQARNANVLINNAGVANFGELASQRVADIEAALKTNLLAPILLTATLLPHFLKQPRSLVINVGSTLGSIGIPGFSTYGAGKAGLRVFSEALRRELTGTAVKIQYLAPRAVDTGFNDIRAKAFNEATGSHMDSAEIVAQALARIIHTEQAEFYLGFVERIGAWLNGISPRLLDGSFSKHRRALRTLPAILSVGEKSL